jgi:hypothetical protein
MFCIPVLIFGGSEDVRSCFHVLRPRNRFRRYRRRRVPFSCFALPDMFSTNPRASGPVFMICALELVLTVPRASGPIFMLCTHGHVFDGTERVKCRFHDLQSQTRFRRYSGRPLLFYVLRSRTRFRRCGGRRVPFSCFALPDSFSALPRASGPVSMVCAPGLVFDGSSAVGSHFHALRSRTRFRRYRGCPLLFYVLHSRIRFRRCGGRRVLFSCFAFLDFFSAFLRASGSVSMLCAPGHVFGGTMGVGCCFQVLLSRTHFRW